MLVIRALVSILKTAPTADIVDEDRFEVGTAGLNAGHQVLQRLAAVKP